MKPETALVNKITKALTARGALVKKVHGSAFGRGWPDLIVISGKGTFFLEVKTPVGKLSALQAATIRKIHDAGGKVSVVQTVDEAIAVTIEGFATSGCGCDRSDHGSLWITIA